MLTRRTDLALEAQELWKESAEKTTRLPGVRARNRKREGWPITRVEILNDTGAKALGKPVGTYVTVDLTAFRDRREDFLAGRCGPWGRSCGSCCPRRARPWWWAWATGP